MTPLELTCLPLVKPLLRSRWPQFLITAIALGGFVFAILAGFVGTPVGSRNFSILFVLIALWALLMLIAVPFFGRGWCSICPIPGPGEWLQRGAILKPVGKGLSLQKRWPKALRNIWLQNGTFVLVALFSTVVLTQPRATAIVLAAFLFVAIAASLVFERRAFCRYLCPVGGFIGLYSQLAPVELRVKDTAVCAAHNEKTCYTGSADGYGCPWQVFPGGLVKNTYCGTCMECLRTCPHDNIALNLRAFGADLSRPTGRKLDEAFKAFIMLVSGLLPGLFLLAVAAGKKWARSRVQPRKAFIAFAYALVPLGLAAWIAFSLAFVFTNLSYLWPALSAPLRWGWDLFGTTGAGWAAYLNQTVPALQTFVILGRCF